jgi:quercetin dioxygenase-like cupin family protein
MMKLKLVAALAAGLFMLSSPAMAQDQAGSHEHAGPKTLVEKKMPKLPAGTLVWRIENFGTLAQAKAAAGPTGLVAEAAGKVWLFTIGTAGGASAGGTKVAEIGPLPPVTATEYLLQVREANNVPGTTSPVHSHPGSEAFYVLSGEMTQKTAQGVTRTAAGQSLSGPAAGLSMQVSNNGSTNLHMLVMFVLDATKPFSSPAKF